MRVRAVFDPALAAEPRQGVPARRPRGRRERPGGNATPSPADRGRGRRAGRARPRAARRPLAIARRRHARRPRPPVAGATRCLSTGRADRHHALRAGRTRHRGAGRHAARRASSATLAAAARRCRSSRWTIGASARHGGRADDRRPRRDQRLRPAPHRSAGAVPRPPDRGAPRQRPRRGRQVGRPRDEERHRARPREAAMRRPRHARACSPR